MRGFEWDEAKDAANRVKHGIGFAEAATIWEGPVLEGHGERHDGEVREVSFGLIAGTTVVCVVHTERHGKTRIISARKATPRERREFDACLHRARS